MSFSPVEKFWFIQSRNGTTLVNAQNTVKFPKNACLSFFSRKSSFFFIRYRLFPLFHSILAYPDSTMVIMLPNFITSDDKRRCETSRRFYFIWLISEKRNPTKIFQIQTRQHLRFWHFQRWFHYRMRFLRYLNDDHLLLGRRSNVKKTAFCSGKLVREHRSRSSFLSSLKLFVPFVYLRFVPVVIWELYYMSAWARNSIIIRCAEHKQTFTTIIVIATE